MTGKISCEGNVMSLLGEDVMDIPCEYCYRAMFEGCSSLTTAPELPATTLASSCYRNMFYNCVKLTTAPELPATTLADYCYQQMFYNCSSLTTAPELPATTLAEYCYYYMFYDCTNLTTVPELSITTFADYSCKKMFSGTNKLSNVSIDNSISNNVLFIFPDKAATGNLYFSTTYGAVPTDDIYSVFLGWELYIDGVHIGKITKNSGDGYYYQYYTLGQHNIYDGCIEDIYSYEIDDSLMSALENNISNVYISDGESNKWVRVDRIEIDSYGSRYTIYLQDSLYGGYTYVYAKVKLQA